MLTAGLQYRQVDNVAIYNLDTSTGGSLAGGAFLNGTVLTGMGAPQAMTIAGTYVLGWE